MWGLELRDDVRKVGSIAKRREHKSYGDGRPESGRIQDMVRKESIIEQTEFVGLDGGECWVR